MTSNCAASPGSTSYAVAVYPDGRGCGQVSTIDGKTGCAAQPAAATPTARSACPSRRHHRAVGRGHPAGAVALRHGPDDRATARSTRRIKPGAPAAAAVPPGVGRGEFGRGVGDGGLPQPDRSAADAAAARPTRRTPPESSTCRRRECPTTAGARVVAVSDTHDRGVPPDAEAEGRHRRRDRRGDRQHAW